MPYVTRTADGQIESLHRHETAAAHEHLADDHADVQAFLGLHRSAGNFVRLDAEFVRVLEDVIDTLIVKNVINITDLPRGAQAKLFARKSFRERVTHHSLRPVDGHPGRTGDSDFGEFY